MDALMYRKGMNEASSFLFREPSADAQLRSISRADPRSTVVCVSEHRVHMCLCTPMTPPLAL